MIDSLSLTSLSSDLFPSSADIEQSESFEETSESEVDGVSAISEFCDLLERSNNVPDTEKLIKTALDQSIHLRDWLRRSNRLKTYYSWAFDDIPSAKCTSEALADAGFMMTSAKNYSAQCSVCDLELRWKVKDDPFERHRSYRPNCMMANLNRPDSDYSVEDVVGFVANRLHHHSYPTVPLDTLQSLWESVDPGIHLKAVSIYLQGSSGTKPDSGESIKVDNASGSDDEEESGVSEGEESENGGE